MLKLEKDAQAWARERVHPSSDHERVWAEIGYEAGARAMNEAAVKICASQKSRYLEFPQCLEHAVGAESCVIRIKALLTEEVKE